MKQSIMTASPSERETQSEKKAVEYYSVEFSVRELAVHYQFRIWCMGSIPVCFLVNENSDILNWLKVGDTLNMKYYSNNSGGSPECLTTLIKDITRKEQGRFKGHFLVGLQILEDQEQVNFI